MNTQPHSTARIPATNLLCSQNLAKVEFYANCANVKVTGSGTATPDDSFLATFSEIYVEGDSALEAIDGTPDSYTVPGPNVWPDDTAEGGQIFEVSGVRNACAGQAQGSGGDCEDGGDDTTNPTPPNPQTDSSSSSSSSSSDDDSSTATTTTSASSATATGSGSSSSSSDDDDSSSDDTSSSDDSSDTDDEDATSTSSSSSSSASGSSSSSSSSDKASASGSGSSSSSSSSSGTVAAYGQCGGGNVAAADCVSGYTCLEVNEWYSQCVAE